MKTKCRSLTLRVIVLAEPMPSSDGFEVGDECLVEFASGKHAIGRVFSWFAPPHQPKCGSRMGIVFSSGRGSRSKMFKD